MQSRSLLFNYNYNSVTRIINIAPSFLTNRHCSEYWPDCIQVNNSTYMHDADA